MTRSGLEPDRARHDLYAVMERDLGFEEKAERALELGKEYLDVENGHIARIDPQSNYWRAIASTSSASGAYPAGQVLDLETTYCRLTLRQDDPLALHDVPEQGLADDPAFERHELHCYFGTRIEIDEETEGTVCFVDADPRGDPFSGDETMFAELVARTLEHELRRRRTAAKIDRLDQFASMVSHDLRNPLNVAKGRLEIARETVDSEHLDIAAEELDRMESLIGEVLTMARQGEEVEETEQVTLSSLAETCWGSVDVREADLVVAEDLRFRADPDRARHLFENLFRNAIEHAGADVTVRVGPLAEQGGFYVEDDGPGIPPDDRDAVFESGYSTGGEGIGLGLSIVEAVASAHHWSIRTTEGPDGGTRFEFGDVVVLPSE